jgi:hypothetical protein
METYIFQVASNFITQGIHPVAWCNQWGGVTSRGEDTCKLRGEDYRYCGAFHVISEINL